MYFSTPLWINDNLLNNHTMSQVCVWKLNLLHQCFAEMASIIAWWLCHWIWLAIMGECFGKSKSQTTFVRLGLKILCAKIHKDEKFVTCENLIFRTFYHTVYGLPKTTNQKKKKKNKDRNTMVAFPAWEEGHSCHESNYDQRLAKIWAHFQFGGFAMEHILRTKKKKHVLWCHKHKRHRNYMLLDMLFLIIVPQSSHMGQIFLSFDEI